MAGSHVFPRLRRVRLSDEVVEKIKEAILMGHFQAGESLPSERELSEMFGVGRPTIREALSVLEYMGLIGVQLGSKGSIVKKLEISQYLKVVREQLASMITISDETINELYEVRQYIELGIALAVAEHATDEEVNSLDEYIEEMESLSDDIELYFPVGIEFHRHLATITHNRIYMILWEMIHDTILLAYNPILKELYPDGPAKLVELNKELVQAIKSKDKGKIRHAMEEHGEKGLYLMRSMNQN